MFKDTHTMESQLAVVQNLLGADRVDTMHTIEGTYNLSLTWELKPKDAAFLAKDGYTFSEFWYNVLEPMYKILGKGKDDHIKELQNRIKNLEEELEEVEKEIKIYKEVVRK